MEPNTEPAAGPADQGVSDGRENDAAKIQKAVGEYMPTPLEGRLEIAAPRGWNWIRAGNKYLVGFVPEGSELNSLPRILVSAGDSPFSALDRVTESNVQEFVDLVSQQKAGEELTEPVEPIVLGDNHLVHYATSARKRNAVVNQQFLETVVGGRLYTIRMEFYEQQIDKYRNAAYAVAMSMKFETADGAPVADEPAQ